MFHTKLNVCRFSLVLWAQKRVSNENGVLISNMALSSLFVEDNLLAAFNKCVFSPILNVKDF